MRNAKEGYTKEGCVDGAHGVGGFFAAHFAAHLSALFAAHFAALFRGHTHAANHRNKRNTHNRTHVVSMHVFAMCKWGLCSRRLL